MLRKFRRKKIPKLQRNLFFVGLKSRHLKNSLESPGNRPQFRVFPGMRFGISKNHTLKTSMFFARKIFIFGKLKKKNIVKGGLTRNWSPDSVGVNTLLFCNLADTSKIIRNDSKEFSVP